MPDLLLSGAFAHIDATMIEWHAWMAKSAGRKKLSKNLQVPIYYLGAMYQVTDLDIVFMETGNGGIIMLFATTRWCCCKKNYSAVLGCQFQCVTFDDLSKFS